MNIHIPQPTPLLLHGFPAALHTTVEEFNTGYISAREMYNTGQELTTTHWTLMANDPYCLHLQGIIADTLGYGPEAIATYTEAAIQLSLIEDTTREAAAYTALARRYHLANNLPAAIRATQNATLLHLHEGNTTSYRLHALYTYALATGLHDPEFLTTPYAQSIALAIHKSIHNAHLLYTHPVTTLAEPTD